MRIKLFVVAFAAFITIGLLEVATRWFYTDLGSTADNTSYFAERWRRHHEVVRNNIGFREHEITAKSMGVTRIAMVGDSITYGQGVDLSERYTEQLETMLGGSFEILNFGDPGANYDAHLANIGLALDIANPDVLVLQWLFNDVQPANEYRPGPMNLAGPLHRFVQPYSALYFFANLGFKQLQADWGLAPQTDYFEQFADPAGEYAVAARARLERVLDVAMATDLPFGMILWPAVFDRSFSSDAALFDQVRAVCAERDIPCLDLRPALAATPSDESLIVSVYDAHPSAYAHAVAAEAILPWLQLLIDSKPGPNG